MSNEYEGWGNPFTQSDPTIKEFKKQFVKYEDEITGIDGKSSGDEDYIGSHKISSSVRVRIINDDSDDDYELVGMDVDRLGGCGCWSGIVLEVRKVK